MPNHQPAYISKKAVTKAGSTLLTAKKGSLEYDAAVEIVNAWRICHGYPINTFQSTLRKKVAPYKDAIVAQRLKRLPTIIDKLKRHPQMKLATMQDVGGVRAIVNSVGQVRNLQAQYEDTKRFTHTLLRVNDYITTPKPDGYRGVHLIYKYNNTLTRYGSATAYNGLLIELQLRTKMQHEWATAVETAGLLRGQSYKTQKGSKNWLEFFKLVSATFAMVEKTPIPTEYEALTNKEIVHKLVKLEKQIKALETLRNLASGTNFIRENIPTKDGHYSLLVLHPGEKRIEIFMFSKANLKKASQKLAEFEAKAAGGENIDPVLVSVAKISSLEKAYPNYFLDMQEFTRKVESITREDWDRV